MFIKHKINFVEWLGIDSGMLKVIFLGWLGSVYDHLLKLAPFPISWTECISPQAKIIKPVTPLMIFTYAFAESEQKWTMEDLINAVSVKHSQNLSYRKATSMFHVPKIRFTCMILGKLKLVQNKVHQQC